MPPSPPPIRVLLVDDHPVFRAGLVSLLRLDSDVVVVGQAGSGAAALRMWAHCQPDICLLDLSMPEMDGLETLRQIRKAQPKARVVMLTSSASPQDADRAVAAILEKLGAEDRMGAIVKAFDLGLLRPSGPLT